MPGMKSIERIVFSKSSGNPIFSQIFGHQRAENEARYTKIYRGQETHSIKVNARYEMNWANSFFKKFGNPIFGQIFGHQRAKNEARNTKMNRGQETHPIRVIPGMKWIEAIVFRKVPETLSTDGRTDIGVNPVYPHSTFGEAWGTIISVQTKFELHCINTFSDTGRKPPFWVNFLATRGPKFGQRGPTVNQFWTLTK